MFRYLRIFKRLFKASLMSEMEYKANFFAFVFFINLWLGINVIFYKSIFSQVNSMGNWGENEALFFVAAFNVVDSLFFLLFFKGIFSLQTSVIKGTYDFTIIKPVSSVFMTLFNSFDISRLINVSFSMILFLVTLRKINIQPFQFFVFLIMMVNGVIIYASIFLIINTLSFYLINIYNLSVVFFDVMEFARMPSVVISGPARILFMFVVPILFISGIPCEFLFGDPNYKLAIASTIISLCFWLISTKFLNFSIKHYSSASS